VFLLDQFTEAYGDKHLDLVAKEKTRMFYIRFEHRQVVEEVSPDELHAAAPKPDVEPEPHQQL
jgi:hypothetical protein